MRAALVEVGDVSGHLGLGLVATQVGEAHPPVLGPRDDSSINASRPNRAKDPDYIKHELLAPRIDWAGTVVVLISPETKDSEYVRWEIEYAARNDRRIVGVYTRGSADCDVPDGLEDYADAIVNWNGDAIVDDPRRGRLPRPGRGAARAARLRLLGRRRAADSGRTALPRTRP